MTGVPSDIAPAADGASGTAIPGVAGGASGQLPIPPSSQPTEPSNGFRPGPVPATDTPSEPAEAGEPRTYTQQELEEHLSKGFSSRDRELTTLKSDLDAREQELFDFQSQVFASSRQLGAARAWVQKLLADNQLDEKYLAVFDQTVSRTGQSASQQTRQARQTTQAWLDQQVSGYQNHLLQASENGQLFDPENPPSEVQAAYDDYIRLGRQSTSGRGSVTPQQLQAAFTRLGTTIQQAREAALRSAAQLSQGQGADEVVVPGPGLVTSPQQNRDRALARGPQNRGSGAPGSVDEQELLAESYRQVGIDPDQVHLADPSQRQRAFNIWRAARRERGLGLR